MKVELIKRKGESPEEKPLYFLVLTGQNESDFAKLMEIEFESQEGFNFNAGIPTKAKDKIVALTLPISKPRY